MHTHTIQKIGIGFFSTSKNKSTQYPPSYWINELLLRERFPHGLFMGISQQRKNICDRILSVHKSRIRNSSIQESIDISQY